MRGIDCERMRILMAPYIDGDVEEERSNWMRQHLEECSECRVALARLTEIDTELIGWGERLDRENPPISGARERLASSLGPLPVRRSIAPWVAAGIGVAAALTLALIAPHELPRGRRPLEGRGFVGIPYIAPLDPRENASIVRMDIRVATLLAAGYRVAADPDAVVPADVLVGEDGRAHAVRVLSDIDLHGTGD